MEDNVDFVGYQSLSDDIGFGDELGIGISRSAQPRFTGNGRANFCAGEQPATDDIGFHPRSITPHS